MRSFVISIVLSLVLVYFAYNALAGDQGLAKWTDLQKQEKELSLVLEGIQREKLDTQTRIDRLSSETLDLDYLEELARKKLAYARSDEIILNVSDGRED
ncbi:FtsB family cell division protein [Hirschia litorea]|uniref:Septum formation initiator family protein n=1 Tax=Hirschia litorea TaxID=1199156 RepID=A0ABW2IHP2_9PROT